MDITVPLQRHVDALIGIKEFAVLDEEEATRIMKVVGYDTICTIEEASNKLYILKHYKANPELDALKRRRSLIEELVNKSVAKYGEDLRYIVEQQCIKMSEEQITKRLSTI